ncbi:MAG: alpha/beta fold hydrolase, partial [Planctomycetales bacterium]
MLFPGPLSISSHFKFQQPMVQPHPPFEPLPFLRNGHAQTVAASFFFPGKSFPYQARQHRVVLEDGDALILHDDRPESWRDGDRVALVVHGLAGCHGSPYAQRIAAKLHAVGIRVFRMDMRGCGAGIGLAKLPYHAGRSQDVAAALQEIAQVCLGSPATAVSYSLGANITLKLLGECGENSPGELDSAVAVSPPIDLLGCVERLRRPGNWMYDRYFVKLLWEQIAQRERQSPDVPTVAWPRRPRRLVEIDDWYTAPLSGFESAEDYYRRCASNQFLSGIRLPTLILTA